MFKHLFNSKDSKELSQKTNVVTFIFYESHHTCSALSIVMVTHSPRDTNHTHRIINLFDGKVVTENIKEKFHV